jgi:putative nucleotidyltransferase with HDIG domain
MTVDFIPDHIASRLDQIDNVATLPHIATEVLEVMRNQSASMRKIATVIEKDPSITVKILKIANSPLWGAVGKIESVQRALVLLGLKQVSNIVIAISLYSTFAKLKPNPNFNREDFWRHAIVTGQIAKRLCSQNKINFNGEEFVAGLIHDLGKIVMDQFFTDAFNSIVQETRITEKSFAEVERDHLECTHAEIGAALLARWNFPESIVYSVRFHHQPMSADEHQGLVAMVSCANWLAKEIFKDETVDVSGIAELNEWHYLCNTYLQLAEFDVQAFAEQVAKELGKNVALNKLISF